VLVTRCQNPDGDCRARVCGLIADLQHFDRSTGLDDIYRMNKLNMLRGTSYFLSRIGFATGTLIQRLVDMSERESSSCWYSLPRFGAKCS